MTPAERLAWATSFCQQTHLRLTGTREKILEYLAEHRLPASIQMMARSEKVGRCAETTVYRTLILFREADLVRQVNLPGTTSYFVLNVPGDSNDFLVCRSCGRVQELSAHTSVSKLEEEIAASSGFASIYHELELYGICPACQSARRNAVPTTKLPNLKRPLTRPANSKLLEGSME